MTVVMQDMQNRQVSVGTEVVDKNTMALLADAGKTLSDNYQISLTGASIISDARMNVTTNENWSIYFGLGAGSDAGSQLSRLNSLLKGMAADERKSLRYINLMAENRAIICDNSTCGG